MAFNPEDKFAMFAGTAPAPANPTEGGGVDNARPSEGGGVDNEPPSAAETD